MEISVGFADKDKLYSEDEYIIEDSRVGRVFVPREGMEIIAPVAIRYEKRPWIERFEVDGVKPLQARRTGYGAKTFRAFVQSLNTIYRAAYDDYAIYPDASEYFRHVTERFVQEYSDAVHARMFKKFCGFVENLWREGTREIHDIAMDEVLPIIMDNEMTEKQFDDSITEEFRKYIGEYNG